MNSLKNIWRSERLVYRAFEAPADDELMVALHGNPEVFVNGVHFLARPWGSAEVAEGRKSMVEGSLLFVVICLKPAGDDEAAKPIGFMNFSNPSLPHFAHHRSTTLGISLHGDHLGKGYGPEAIRWGLNWAFRMAGLHRVGLHVSEYNARAAGVYRKLGFVEEGRERESVWLDGRWWDYIQMGLLAREWEAIVEKEGQKQLA